MSQQEALATLSAASPASLLIPHPDLLVFALLLGSPVLQIGLILLGLASALSETRLSGWALEAMQLHYICVVKPLQKPAQSVDPSTGNSLTRYQKPAKQGLGAQRCFMPI